MPLDIIEDAKKTFDERLAKFEIGKLIIKIFLLIQVHYHYTSGHQ